MSFADRWFYEHPRSVGESYSEHFSQAWGFGVTLCIAGFACICHAICPRWFVHTASRQVKALNDQLQKRAHECDQSQPS